MKEDVAHSEKEESALDVTEDAELLRRYVDAGSQDAFAALVRRRIGMVYSVALRQTHGDRHRAEDATQAVFSDLARKATSLVQRPVLAGWLYRSAQFAAAGMVRAEQRRQTREQEADSMEKILAPDNPERDWEKVRPVLDEALSEIGERDRDAIVLRYFDGRRFADIATRLRLSEGAARMRVERALDKLNAVLARRGITSTTTALGVALGQQVGVATPAGLAATVTGTALAQTTVGAAGLLGTFLGMSKLQLGVASAVVVAGVTGYTLQEQNHAAMRAELARLQEQQQRVVALQAENQQLTAAAAEVERLRDDDAEFKRLAQTITAVQKDREETARRERQRETQRVSEQSAQAEIERMNREGNKLVKEYRALVTQSKDSAAAPEVRARADAAAKLKLEEIKLKQREIQTFTAATRGASAPQFKVVEGSQYVPIVDGTESSRNSAANGDLVSVRLPKADHITAFSAIESITGLTVTRDPSLANVHGTLDLITGTCTKQEAMQALGVALREQMNIVLESRPDGTLIAKLGSSR